MVIFTSKSFTNRRVVSFKLVSIVPLISVQESVAFKGLLPDAMTLTEQDALSSKKFSYTKSTLELLFLLVSALLNTVAASPIFNKPHPNL